VLDALGRPHRPAKNHDALDISDAMKARLRGIALAKALAEAEWESRTGPRLPDREFLLTASTLKVHMPVHSAARETAFVSVDAVSARSEEGARTVRGRKGIPR
jgi:hypothetical protein